MASRQHLPGLVAGLGRAAGILYYKRIAKALDGASDLGLMLVHGDLRKVLDTVRDDMGPA